MNDYEAHKICRDELELNVRNASNKLKVFEETRNAYGLVPDSVRTSSEYKNAKQEFNDAFNALRSFNAYFVKKFKKEIHKERKNRFS